MVLILSFLRLYDVSNFYTCLYDGKHYENLFQQIRDRSLDSLDWIVEESFSNISFKGKMDVISDFLSFNVRFFYKFKFEVLRENFELAP